MLSVFEHENTRTIASKIQTAKLIFFFINHSFDYDINIEIVFKIEHVCSFFIFSYSIYCIVQFVKYEIFLKKLGNRIKDFRKKNNFTQLDLATAMENHPEQIGRIERGQLNVSICTLQKIAQVLNITLSHLVDVEK
jgi:DNA-binding XRE family transcriptional regulator